MDSKSKVLNAVKYISVSILTVGIVIFALGIIGSEYRVLTSVGIGTITGAVFRAC